MEFCKLVFNQREGLRGSEPRLGCLLGEVRMVSRKAGDIKKYKMKELAQQAGVSVATAYRVVKQTAQVSPGREARVMKLARDLGIPIRQTSPSKVISFLLGNRPTLHAF